MRLERALPVAAAVLVFGSVGAAGCGGGSGGDSGGDGDGDEAALFVDTPKTVELVDKTWKCHEPVNLALVKVTIRKADKDAIHLSDGCTGRIGRIEVVQYWRDGVKVHSGAHDLVVSGGTIRCYRRKRPVHQDGIQAMGGTRVTFVGVDIRCPTANNSPFFVRRGRSGRGRPTDVTCVQCYLSGGSFTVRVNDSVRSGVRDSTICTGRFGAVRILPEADAPVNDGNTIRTNC